MIDRHLLRYFLAVVDTGNFSRAAAQCRVSQPTVSSGIGRLEEVTGQILFVRSNRRVELSPAGARLVAHARRIEAEFIEAQRALSDVAPSSTIRIGIASTLSSAFTERIATACLAQPKLRLEMIERRPGELVSLLDRGRVDIVVGPHADNPNRRQLELYREPFVLVMHPGHPLATSDVLSCEQLIDEPMLVRRQCEALSAISKFFTARGVRPFMAARSASEDRIAGFVRAGLGMTIMPRSLVSQGMSEKALLGLDITRTIALTFDPAAEARLNRFAIPEMLVSLANEMPARAG